MRTLALLTLIVSVLLLAGCGDGTEPESPPQASSFHGCTLDNVDRTGRAVGRLRDGTGTVTLRLVPAGARRCPSSLVAGGGSGVTGTSVAGLDLDAATARVLRGRGSGGPDLLLVSTARSGGRVQSHLFDVFAHEVTVDGRPVLPALDLGRRTPVDATCTRDGFAVVTAEAHQPPGIVLAWDVTRTSYDLTQGRVEMSGARSVVQAAADPVLRKQHPELYDGRLLANCR